MDLANLIREKVKKKEVVIGYNNVIKILKTGKPKMIVLANNIPQDRKDIIIHNAKIAKVEVKEFDNDNVNLGLVCGKPFSVSVLAIKGS
ncbi:MAG: 50S ribosomal protein L30e [Candidatus Aenigmatarchaeota archaeon]|nr:50S ribosomal protein L30e [Candidatus Aenigmarchaeota archaeon]